MEVQRNGNNVYLQVYNCRSYYGGHKEVSSKLIVIHSSFVVDLILGG